MTPLASLKVFPNLDSATRFIQIPLGADRIGAIQTEFSLLTAVAAKALGIAVSDLTHEALRAYAAQE